MDARARRLAPILEVVVAVVALVCVTVGWLQPTPELTDDEAVATIGDALRGIGIDDPRVVAVDKCKRAVAGTAVKPEYGPAFCNDGSPAAADEVVSTWEGQVAVDQSTIVVALDRSSGRVAYIDDVVGGTTRLLTDEQFAELGTYDGAGSEDDHRTRNIVLTVAAVLAALTAEQLRRRLPRPAAPTLALEPTP